MDKIWNADFTKEVPDGKAGTQAQWGIFYRDQRGRWKRLTEAEGNEFSYNPEIKETNPIGQESKEDVIMAFNTSFGKDIIIKKGKPNYEFFHEFELYQPTGDNAKLEIVIAEFFYSEKNGATGHHKYLAYLFDTTCTVDSSNKTDGKLTVNFKQAGDRVIGVIYRTDDGAGEQAYEFTPCTEIPVEKIALSDKADTDGVSIAPGKKAYIAVSFSPLGCPFDFNVEVEEGKENICTAERVRQSIIINGLEEGTATVTLSSSGVDKEIEVTVTL